MLTQFLRSSACLLLLLGLSGCAVHTPYKVVRFWADYNTERACNAQVEVFDHLPPNSARVKVTRWGYNVGPANPSGTGTFGIGTGVWEERLYFWRWFGKKHASEEVIYIAPPTPPGEPLPETLLPTPAEAMPLLPQPAPPADSAKRPSANATASNQLVGKPKAAQGITQVGYQTSQPQSALPPKKATNASWVFLPSTLSKTNGSR